MIMLTLKDMKKLSLGLLPIMVWLLPMSTYADENNLSIKPTRCIALHEGQVCYQTLNIQWKADVADTYCLYRQDSKELLMCWENIASGKGRYEFESNTTQKFILMRKQDAKPMAAFSVEVAWVYDASSRRESHWRIF